MEIDIREDESEKVDITRFDAEGILQKRGGCLWINVAVDSESYKLSPAEIDNLIKALQKAKQLWT
jgi:hypothetical protein